MAFLAQPWASDLFLAGAYSWGGTGMMAMYYRLWSLCLSARDMCGREPRQRKWALVQSQKG